MFYLSVLLPSIIVTTTYYILILVRTERKQNAVKGLICFLLFSASVALIIVAVKLGVKSFTNADFFSVLLSYLGLLVALVSVFLQFKIFSCDDSKKVLQSNKEVARIGELIEITKSAIKETETKKSPDVVRGEFCQVGYVLEDRTTQNATAEEIEVSKLRELYKQASTAKNAYRHKKELTFARSVFDNLAIGKPVKKVDVETTMDSLIKILSNENFEV